jgi:hypothetical protein
MPFGPRTWDIGMFVYAQSGDACFSAVSSSLINIAALKALTRKTGVLFIARTALETAAVSQAAVTVKAARLARQFMHRRWS